MYPLVRSNMKKEKPCQIWLTFSCYKSIQLPRKTAETQTKHCPLTLALLTTLALWCYSCTAAGLTLLHTPILNASENINNQE